MSEISTVIKQLLSTPTISLMKVFVSCMAVLALLLLILVLGVWQQTTSLTREASRASYTLPTLQLVRRFTSANASLQSQGLLLANAQSEKELDLRKQALWDSITATEVILDTFPTQPIAASDHLADSLSQIKSVVLGLSLLSHSQLMVINDLNRLVTESQDELDRMIRLVQLRVVTLTDMVLDTDRFAMTTTEVNPDNEPDAGMKTLSAQDFDVTNLDVQDYLLFNQDLVRLKALVERVPLLQKTNDILIAEQQRDLLFRTMVSRAIHIHDSRADELLLTPLDNLRSSLRKADSLFTSRRKALQFEQWESQTSALLSDKISNLEKVAEKSRLDSEAILIGSSTNTLASIARYRLFLAIGLAACFLVLGSISYFLLYRRTVVPLKEITDQLDRVGTSRYCPNNAPYLIDEIQSIALAIASLDSAQKSMQEKDHQLHVNNGNLQRANEDIEQFARVASHDMQEPLRKLQQLSDILQEDYKDSFDEDGTYFLQAIAKESQRMSTMIRDTLYYARTARLDLVTQVVDIENVIDTLRVDLELMLHEADTTLTVDKLPEIIANPTGLTQLLRNLLVNAIKYRRPGNTNQIRIGALYSATEPVMSIEIEDNGIGIAQEDLLRIFSPFERLYTEPRPGTGLGLAICSKVCAAHGWSIDVTSQLNSGSCFHIHLPLEHIVIPSDSQTTRPFRKENPQIQST